MWCLAPSAKPEWPQSWEDAHVTRIALAAVDRLVVFADQIGHHLGVVNLAGRRAGGMHEPAYDEPEIFPSSRNK